MSSHVDRQLRQWAREKNGDPLSPSDVRDMLLALDADGEARHAELMERMAAHQADADDRDARIAAVCAALDVHAADTTAHDHVRLHNDHVATRHGVWTPDMQDRRRCERREPTEEEFQTHFMWGLGSRFAGVAFAVLGAALMLFINLLIYGRP